MNEKPMKKDTERETIDEMEKVNRKKIKRERIEKRERE